MTLNALNNAHSSLQLEHISHLSSFHKLGNIISPQSYIQNYFNPQCEKCQFHKRQFMILNNLSLKAFWKANNYHPSTLQDKKDAAV